MIPVCIIALAAAIVVAVKLYGKNKSLQASVAELGRQVAELAEPKPFGLDAIERIGAMLGGLNPEVARVAYAAAAVCERPNTVVRDTEEALVAKSAAISNTKDRIADLEGQVRVAQADLGTHERRKAALEAIEDLLP